MPEWLRSVLQMVVVLLNAAIVSLLLIAWERSAMRKRAEPLKWHPPQGCKRCGRAKPIHSGKFPHLGFYKHYYHCNHCGHDWNEKEAR